MKPVSTLTTIVFQHPMAKAVLLGLFSLVGNILAGTFVFEITESRNGISYINWNDCYRSPSFWSLIMLLIILGLYSWKLASIESALQTELASTKADLARRLYRQYLASMDNVQRAIDHGKVVVLQNLLSEIDKEDGS